MRLSRTVVAATVLALLAGIGAVYVANRPGLEADDDRASAAIPVPDLLSPLRQSALPDAAKISATLKPLVRDTALGSVAAVVVDASTGAELYARRPETALPPASTVKLLTAAAALAQLPKHPAFTTGVVRKGRTLYLVGDGDVTLTARPEAGYPPTATLAELAKRTATALPTSAVFRLRYDTTAWSGPSLAPGWTGSYITSGNVSRLSALEVDEARIGKGATAPRAVDPARQAADAFRQALVDHGVHEAGAPRAAAAPSSGLGIAVVFSPSISALVTRMLTNSDNDLAEALGRAVARQDGRPATFAGAAAAVTDAIRQLGVPTRGVRLYDASGLSRDDRVTPRALAAVLRAVAQGEPPLRTMTAALPVAGFTGTLADRFRHGPSRVAAGAVRAKTGTLAGVNALAGQVVDVDGRLLVFAFLAEHVPLPGPAEHGLDRLAAALARCGCTSASPPTAQ